MYGSGSKSNTPQALLRTAEETEEISKNMRFIMILASPIDDIHFHLHVHITCTFVILMG